MALSTQKIFPKLKIARFGVLLKTQPSAIKPCLLNPLLKFRFILTSTKKIDAILFNINPNKVTNNKID